MPNFVHGTSGKDWIDFDLFSGPNNGADWVFGYEENDTIFGYGGNDRLMGMDGDDHLFGGDDHDRLIGGAGADRLHGGNGDDEADYSGSPSGVIVSLISDMASGGDAAGDHFDSIEILNGSAHADTLIGDNGINLLFGEGGNDTLKGYGGLDFIWGGLGNDYLYGMEGVDTLRGNDGHDHIDGGPGDDLMIGGIGNDTYVVDNAGDEVTEAIGEGNDAAYASVSWTMTAGASIETLGTTNETGTTAINLTGNAIGNHLIGNDGPNILNGGGGIDHMTGNGGNDIYRIDNASDWVTEEGGGGSDEAWTSVSWTMTDNADIETLHPTSWVSTDPLNLTGNETGNVVWGNSGNNVLNGGGGMDELISLGGYNSFLFNTELSEMFNIDDLSDFEVFWDTILLDQTIFSSSLGLGNIADGELVIGAAALDANDRIIYNSATGALSYDSDGNGGTAAIQFATLDPGLALTNLDFLVVA